MAQRDWYIAPKLVQAEDVEANPYVPAYTGPGSNGEMAVIPGMVCKAYQTNDILVGLLPGTTPPGDWTPQTPAQAQAHFLSVVGRNPNPGEVE